MEHGSRTLFTTDHQFRFQMPLEYEKGFNPTLYDCIDRALSSLLGRQAVSTFYFAVEEKFNLPEAEFERRPLELIYYLRSIFGEAGFGIVEKAIVSQFKATFQITNGMSDLASLVELAKNNYLRA
jgi:hypothetical protein